MAASRIDYAAFNSNFLGIATLTSANCCTKAAGRVDLAIRNLNRSRVAILATTDCCAIVTFRCDITAVDDDFTGITILAATDCRLIASSNIECAAVNRNITADVCSLCCTIFVDTTNMFTGQTSVPFKCHIGRLAFAIDIVNIVFILKCERNTTAIGNRELTQRCHILKCNAGNCRTKADSAFQRVTQT